MLQLVSKYGADNITQVVLDSAGDCKKARRLIKQEFPKIAVGAPGVLPLVCWLLSHDVLLR